MICCLDSTGFEMALVKKLFEMNSRVQKLETEKGLPSIFFSAHIKLELFFGETFCCVYSIVYTSRPEIEV